MPVARITVPPLLRSGGETDNQHSLDNESDDYTDNGNSTFVPSQQNDGNSTTMPSQQNDSNFDLPVIHENEIASSEIEVEESLPCDFNPRQQLEFKDEELVDPIPQPQADDTETQQRVLRERKPRTFIDEEGYQHPTQNQTVQPLRQKWEPAFKSGTTYDLGLQDGPVRVHKTNGHRSYEVSFPAWQQGPDQRFTLSEKDLTSNAIKMEETIKSETGNATNNDVYANFTQHELAAFADDRRHTSIFADAKAYTTSHTNDAYYWQGVMHDNVLYPAGEFTIGKTISPLESEQCAHLAQIHSSIGKAMPQIGLTLADEVLLPRFHFQVKNHPLREYIYKAESLEYQTLDNMDAWVELDTLPPGATITNTLWVYRAKPDKNGMLERIKARLTLRGDQQKLGLAPEDTYSPVMNMISLRTLLSLHCKDPEVIYMQADIKAAFLTAKCKRPTYITPPEGFGRPGAILQLERALYGGADSGRAFYDEFTIFHKEIGFSAILHDRCYLSITDDSGNFIKFVFHVDDMAIAYKGEKLWQWYLTKLRERYEFTLGPLEHFLGIRITRNADRSFRLDQSAQVEKMLRTFNLEKAKPVDTPVGGKRPTKADSPVTSKERADAAKIPYMQAVGHLNYLQTTSHLEISFPLKVASHFMCCYGQAHWTWVKHIMKYLAGHQWDSLIIRGHDSPPMLISYSDADHANCKETGRSFTGYIIKLGDDTINYGCHRQRIPAHSSTESEIMAVDSCVRDLQYIRQLVHAMGGPNYEKTALPVRVDNQQVIPIAEGNPIQLGRNRHMHARYWYYVYVQEEGEIKMGKVNSEENIADILVTFKTPKNFHYLVQMAKGYVKIPSHIKKKKGCTPISK